MVKVREITVLSQTVDLKSIQLHGHIWSPGNTPFPGMICVFVHPWGMLGGSSANTISLARVLAKAYKIECLTFDLRGIGKSEGTSSIKCEPEVQDVKNVCNYAVANLSKNKIILVGSSAGAAIAGSALDTCVEVIGYIGIGYTFGWLSSWVFGKHFKAIMTSSKPKLFIQGDADVFTSVDQLEHRVASMQHAQYAIIPNCGHFDLENGTKIEKVCSLIVEFIECIFGE